MHPTASMFRSRIMRHESGKWSRHWCQVRQNHLHLATLGEELGEQRLASDGIADMESTAGKNTFATLGFSNQMRCINTGATRQASGIVRSDQNACNVVLGSAEVKLNDREGNPCTMKALFSLQYRPVEPGKQLKAYYGAAYTLDEPDTGSPSGTAAQIKEEPQD